MPRKDPYLDPVPPVNVGTVSRQGTALLMEIYYFSYLTENRLLPMGRMAVMELMRKGLIKESRQGAGGSHFLILTKTGYRYARWIETQTGLQTQVTPHALGLRYLGLL